MTDPDDDRDPSLLGNPWFWLILLVSGGVEAGVILAAVNAW